MKGNGNKIIVAVITCVLSILIGYLATSFVKLLFSSPKAGVSVTSTKSSGMVDEGADTETTPGTVASPESHPSMMSPVILMVDCVYHPASGKYRIYATVNNEGDNSLSFRLESQNGASKHYQGEQDSNGRWVLREISPSTTPYSLVAVNEETGMESEPFQVNGCLPQRRITASELAYALNHWDDCDQDLIHSGVIQQLDIVIIGDDDNKTMTNLLQIVNTIRGNNWKSVSVSNVRYNESNKIIGFTLNVVKTDP